MGFCHSFVGCLSILFVAAPLAKIVFVAPFVDQASSCQILGSSRVCLLSCLYLQPFGQFSILVQILMSLQLSKAGRSSSLFVTELVSVFGLYRFLLPPISRTCDLQLILLLQVRQHFAVSSLWTPLNPNDPCAISHPSALVHLSLSNLASPSPHQCHTFSLVRQVDSPVPNSSATAALASSLPPVPWELPSLELTCHLFCSDLISPSTLILNWMRLVWELIGVCHQGLEPVLETQVCLIYLLI